MADKNGIFEKVDSGVRIYRSRFNRSFQKLIDVYPGRLYPILADIMMPGDVVKLGLRWNIKSNPSVTPFFTRVKGSVFYFAVPLRQIFGSLYGDKENFIENLLSGGPDGNNTDTIPLLSKPEFFMDFGSSVTSVYYSNADGSNPLWHPLSSASIGHAEPFLVSLSNCFGYPTFRGDGVTVPSPVKYPPTVTFHRAYWKIVSDYFIDEDVQSSLVDGIFFSGLSSWAGPVEPGFPFQTLWSRDYFMSSMTSFLKGTPPALDLGYASFPGDIYNTSGAMVFGQTSSNSGVQAKLVADGSGYKWDFIPPSGGNPGNGNPKQQVVFPAVTSPVTGSISVDDIRLAFATQRILERANRCGSRYTEYLMSTFGTAPADGTLQRAWYLGGVRFNIVTPEVLQTSESASTPQGTRTGAGFSVGQQGIHSYHCKEWSVLMAVLNVEPEATYCDGLPRQARYRSRFDFFNPSMQNLSEQVVEKGEIFSDVTNSLASYNPSAGFGYQGMWNELRTKMDEVSGNFRYSELDNWHMALRFKSVPALSPVFKEISTYFSDWMRPFAVRTMPPFLCSFYHDMIWVRPMVRHPVPGLVDHN